MSEQWVGPSEAMAHLSVGSRTALRRLINDHRLPYSRIGKNRYRFRISDLDAWMLKRGSMPLRKVS